MTRSNYIGARWIEAKGGGSLPVINPATEETIEDIDEAVKAAATAFRTWRQTTGKQRAGLLRSIAAAITAEREQLARIEVQDNGKPLPEALWDIDDAAGCFAYYADLADELAARRRRRWRCRMPGSPPSRGASRSAWRARSSRGTTLC
jgi:betaine-aldehyde dehydrogenase